MTWDPASAEGAHLCAECGVIVLPAGAGWEHPGALRVKFSQTVCGSPRPGRPAKDREVRYGRGNEVKQDNAVHGQVDDQPAAGGPIVVACDGSLKRNPDGPPWWPISWGYVATNGQWGLGWTIQSAGVVGNRVLGAELRAIFWARERLPSGQPIEVLTDSADAVGLTERWRGGDLVMPPGYSVERQSGNEAKMLLLARRVASAPDAFQASWVRAGSGHPLHSAADALAKTARLWAFKQISKDQARVDGARFATGGLASWQRRSSRT
ncbi:RNase H family protein [Micromonospora sp. NPDC049366]|uniref:RNase H family protein n=1 Tax=Micromonospora sp. NPDC049366 TaxID=3364271 RepID=UPI0037B6FB8F